MPDLEGRKPRGKEEPQLPVIPNDAEWCRLVAGSSFYNFLRQNFSSCPPTLRLRGKKNILLNGFGGLLPVAEHLTPQQRFAGLLFIYLLN